MKHLFFLLYMSVFLVSCSTALAPVEYNDTTWSWALWEKLPEISSTEISDAIGISEFDLRNLFGEELTEKITDGGEGLTIQARGTEPFWDYRYSSGSVVWSEIAVDDRITETFSVIPEIHDNSIFLSIPEFESTLYQEDCSDGMSDILYDYRVTIQKWEKTYSGCAILGSS